MEFVLEKASEKVLLLILFKINYLSQMNALYDRIYQNNVLLKDNYIESLFFYLKQFYQMVNKAVNVYIFLKYCIYFKNFKNYFFFNDKIIFHNNRKEILKL